MDDLLVLGLGNQLMSDDGIGVVVARRLQRRPMAGVRVVAAGTPGFELADTLAAQSRVIIIDAVDDGRTPGSVFWVEPESIMSDLNRQSLHQVGLGDVLALMAVVGRMPWVGIIGVQPMLIEAGPRLSAPLRRRLPIITTNAVGMVESALQCGISNDSR